MSIQKYRKYLKAHSLYCRNEANFVTKRKKFHNPPDRIAHRSRDSIYPIFMVITYYVVLIGISIFNPHFVSLVSGATAAIETSNRPQIRPKKQCELPRPKFKQRTNKNSWYLCPFLILTL